MEGDRPVHNLLNRQHRKAARGAPNLLLTPHVSGNMSLPRTCELVIEIFLRNLAHWEKGEPLEHQVDRAQGY